LGYAPAPARLALANAAAWFAGWRSKKAA
jgi:hypothetical protein